MKNYERSIENHRFYSEHYRKEMETDFNKNNWTKALYHESMIGELNTKKRKLDNNEKQKVFKESQKIVNDLWKLR